MTSRQTREYRDAAKDMAVILLFFALVPLFASATSPFVSTMTIIMWATSGALVLASAAYGIRAAILSHRIR